MRRFVSAHLDVGPLVSVGEPGLRHLQRPLLLPVSVLQLRNGRLRVSDLVDRLQSEEEDDGIFRAKVYISFLHLLNFHTICINVRQQSLSQS